MSFLGWLVICTIFGMCGMFCIPLSIYVDRMSEEGRCDGCAHFDNCVALKPMFGDSNVVSQFMLFAFFGVKADCMYCKHIPIYKYFIYLFFNAMLVGILYWSGEDNPISVVFGISTSMLLALSVVDWNTQFIPVEYTGVILICGLIRLFADVSNWWEYVIGLFAVSGFLYIVNIIGTVIMKKRYGEDEIDGVIGDGDIKLMAATGLLLGWKLNFLALGIGCIAGSVIHVILMKVKGSEKKLALGPYLSLGVYITMICGEQLVGWYLNMVGITPLQ
ncbi:MAG: A24 family peptidase [Lachnospiraceae bacterium]|nr:A24 family peptidase [Lachnospiraceae bacterium]